MFFFLFFFIDFELQAGMVELFVRLIPCAIRYAKALEYFINKSVSQAFKDINNGEFEAVSLRFMCIKKKKKDC